MVRYTPMESGTHELLIMLSYYHGSGSDSRYKHASYSSSMLAPSLLYDAVPVVKFLDSESNQPMRWCNSTEMGGKQASCPTRWGHSTCKCSIEANTMLVVSRRRTDSFRSCERNEAMQFYAWHC
jgi:hypothetical protein